MTRLSDVKQDGRRDRLRRILADKTEEEQEAILGTTAETSCSCWAVAHCDVRVLHLLWVFNIIRLTVIHACSSYC